MQAHPVGLELYSVRDEMKKDLLGTVRRVGQMGYEGVEFYSPYFDWTPEHAKEVRKVMDEVKSEVLVDAQQREVVRSREHSEGNRSQWHSRVEVRGDGERGPVSKGWTAGRKSAKL